MDACVTDREQFSFTMSKIDYYFVMAKQRTLWYNNSEFPVSFSQPSLLENITGSAVLRATRLPTKFLKSYSL
jgi:hypothetical protein